MLSKKTQCICYKSSQRYCQLSTSDKVICFQKKFSSLGYTRLLLCFFVRKIIWDYKNSTFFRFFSFTLGTRHVEDSRIESVALLLLTINTNCFRLDSKGNHQLFQITLKQFLLAKEEIFSIGLAIL